MESDSYLEHSLAIRETGRSLYRDGYERVVFTNGCFDILHPGHLWTLLTARRHAGPRGAVVVGINSDESVRRLKGSDRPIFPEDARAQLLVSMRGVDHVVVFDEDTPLQLIESLRPDIIVKGGDHAPETVVGRHIATVVSADYQGSWSTSSIIEKIRNE